MSRRARRALERVVYGFLGWFESFNSVWQTTIVIFGGWAIEAFFPSVDRGHLVFLLVLSLYATFTQNGLAHENKLTSDKLDQALVAIDSVVDDVYVAAQTLVQMATNETHMQTALVAQTEAILAALTEVRSHLAKPKPKRR
jgi:hypothetical protein